MKKIFLVLTLVLASALSSCSDKITAIQSSELPEKAQTFISDNWHDATILSVTKERDGFTTEYTVALNENTRIDFDKHGAWKDVQNTTGIVTGFLPVTIPQYVTSAFPQYVIIQVEKDRKNYHVDLNNDIDLLFDSEGLFLGMDD